MVIEACASQILFRPSSIHNNIAHALLPSTKGKDKRNRVDLALGCGLVMLVMNQG